VTAVLDPSRPVILGDRYELIRPLASGGMAEIFLARQKALAGFEKDVVVKLLKDRFRDDERVVEMFLEEARIGAVLNHPNIVHVYDVGEHQGVPFIAMELIHGEELSVLCRRGLEAGRFLPIQHAVDLIRQAAEGMGYFQAKRRDDGEQMDIIHRDISPSNLLVTQDGILKVIDFGIARAKTRGGRRVEGLDKLVPGKFNYMSPEQVKGEKVDHRSDLFSLGIVLYEITVGKRLFKGRPEEVMRKVVSGKIKPPTFVRQKFPPELEAIVMRALESHPEDRYQSAYELAGELEEYLEEAGLKSGPFRIAQYLDDLRAAEGGERRKELMLVGQAWVDDDADDALDFDRQFAEVVRAEESAPAGRASDWDDETEEADEDDVHETGRREKLDPHAIATPVVPIKALPAEPPAVSAPPAAGFSPQPTGPPPRAIPPGSMSKPMPAVTVDEPDRNTAVLPYVIILALLATAAGVVSFLLMR
jgi:tRNA A-37 threonylcarbamoyl transferase component Bud32